MSLISRTDGSAANEYLVAIALLALGGISAFGILGKGTANAIAGESAGGAASMNVAAAVLVSNQAGRDTPPMVPSAGGGVRVLLGTDLASARAAYHGESNGSGAPSVGNGNQANAATKLGVPNPKALRKTRTNDLLLALAAMTNGNHPVGAGEPETVSFGATLGKIASAFKHAKDPNGMSADGLQGHLSFWNGRFGNLTDFDVAAKRGEIAKSLLAAEGSADSPENRASLAFMQFVDNGLAQEQFARRYEDSLLNEIARREKTDDANFQAAAQRLAAVRGVQQGGDAGLADKSLAEITDMRANAAEGMAKIEKGTEPLTDDERAQADAIAKMDRVLMEEQFNRGMRILMPAVALSEARKAIRKVEPVRVASSPALVVDRSQWPPYSSPKNSGMPNGRIPADQMMSLGIPENDSAPGAIREHMMWRPAAIRFVAMKAAMEQAGVWAGLNESYRTYDKQVYFKNCQNTGACNNGNRAATPGTSNHGWGMAVDIQIGAGTFEWLSAHAAEFGFDNVEGANAGENWHWGYTGADER